MKEYIIEENKHYSCGINLGLTFKNSIERNIIFDKSCLYELEGNDKFDINKLFGFSTTYHHQKQSARYGWRCLGEDNIEIYTYVYDNSKLLTRKLINIANIQPQEKINLKITDENNYFRFDYLTKTENGSISIQKTPLSFPFKYFLYPYFGGNKKSPHKMKILMDLQ